MPRGRGHHDPNRDRVNYTLTLTPVEHALAELAAARRDVSLRQHLHDLVRGVPMPDAPVSLPEPSRNLAANYGGEVVISDETEADKISGSFGRRAEAAALASGEAIATLSTRGTSITNRPGAGGTRPTLDRDGAA
jgi:hypothetical protein